MHLTANIGEVVDNNHTALVVNLGSVRFVELDARLLVADDVAQGLHDGAVLDRAGRA